MSLLVKRFKRCKEDFICEYCQTKVIGNGYTNHCPHCLYSKHVDINPGDRASPCKGLMKPALKGIDKKGYYIMHYCEGCKIWKKNKVSPQDDFAIVDSLNFG